MQGVTSGMKLVAVDPSQFDRVSNAMINQRVQRVLLHRGPLRL